MIPRQLQSLIRQIELTTRKKISGPLFGGVHSPIRGLGFEFNQLREYIPGDDIRFIDWKSSARASKMLVREFLEDRNRTLYLVVDMSASTSFGTVSNEFGQPLSKTNLIRELAAILAFSSLHAHDSVGLILFSEQVEKCIPARRSRNHVLSLVQTLFTYTPKFEGTNVHKALEYVARLKGQRALVCLLSDFMAPLEGVLLSAVSRHHDVMALRCLDPRERSFPQVGALIFEDKESQTQLPVADSYRLEYKLKTWHERQKELLAAARIDMLDCEVGVPYAIPLLQFLKYRVYR